MVRALIGMKTNSLKKNYIFSMLYQILVTIIPLITTPYVSRVLKADGIGAYSYSLSIVTYFGLFGSLGVDLYGTLRIAKVRDDILLRSSEFWNIFIARVCTLSISTIIYAVFIQSVKDPLYRALFITLLLYMFSQMTDIAWFFNGLELMDKTVVRNMFIKIAGAVLIFVLIREKDQIVLYCAILQGSTLLGNILLWPYLRKYISFGAIKEVNQKCIINNWKLSLLYFLPAITSTVFTALDKSMIYWITGSSFENGYYEQAYKIYQLLNGAIISLSLVFLPRITYMWSDKNNIQDIRGLLYKGIYFALMISVPMAFGVVGVAKEFVPLFYGPGYDRCVVLISIFSVMVLIGGITNFIGQQCLMARGCQNKYNLVTIICAGVNILLNTIMIFLWKSVGAAIASVLSQIVMLYLFYRNSKDIIDPHDYYEAKNIVLAGLVMFLAIEIVGLLPFQSVILLLATKILLGIFIYFLMLFVVLKDTFSVEMLKNLARRIKN